MQSNPIQTVPDEPVLLLDETVVEEEHGITREVQIGRKSQVLLEGDEENYWESGGPGLSNRLHLYGTVLYDDLMGKYRQRKMRGFGCTTDVGMRRRVSRFTRYSTRGGPELCRPGRSGRALAIRGEWYVRWTEWSEPTFLRHRTHRLIHYSRRRCRSPMGHVIRKIRGRLAQRCDTFCVRPRSREPNRSGRGCRWTHRSTICIGIRAAVCYVLYLVK